MFGIKLLPSFFLWGLGPKPWELDCHIQVRLHVSYLIKIITHRYDWRPAYQIIFHWDSWTLDSQVTPDWVKLIINKSRPIHLGRFSSSVKKKSRTNPKCTQKLASCAGFNVPPLSFTLFISLRTRAFSFFLCTRCPFCNLVKVFATSHIVFKCTH